MKEVKIKKKKKDVNEKKNQVFAQKKKYNALCKKIG